MTVDTSWIKPGAEVVLWRKNDRHNPREAVVERVTRTTFTVSTVSKRFNLDTQRTAAPRDQWDRYGPYCVAPLNSPEAQKLLADRREQLALSTARTNARRAVETWSRGDVADLALIEEAVGALQALHGVVSEQRGSDR